MSKKIMSFLVFVLLQQIVFAQKTTSVKFKYINNTTGRCAWDNSIVTCEKKADWSLEVDRKIIELVGPLQQGLSEIWYSTFIGQLGLAMGSTEEKQVAKEIKQGIFRINLYSCPTFCSQKCEVECANNNCKH